MQDKNPGAVVEHMMHTDAFSQWLDIKILRLKKAIAKLQ